MMPTFSADEQQQMLTALQQQCEMPVRDAVSVAPRCLLPAARLRRCARFRPFDSKGGPCCVVGVCVLLLCVLCAEVTARIFSPQVVAESLRRKFRGPTIAQAKSQYQKEDRCRVAHDLLEVPGPPTALGPREPSRVGSRGAGVARRR